MNLWKKLQAYVLSIALVVATSPLDGCKKTETNPAQSQASQANTPPATNAVPTAEQLYQLVAPIASNPAIILPPVNPGCLWNLRRIVEEAVTVFEQQAKIAPS
jgi:hypothetical protein